MRIRIDRCIKSLKRGFWDLFFDRYVLNGVGLEYVPWQRALQIAAEEACIALIAQLTATRMAGKRAVAVPMGRRKRLNLKP